MKLPDKRNRKNQHDQIRNDIGEPGPAEKAIDIHTFSHLSPEEAEGSAGKTAGDE